MRAIDVLMNEHRNIELGLDALEVFVEQAAAGPIDDEKQILADFIRFVRGYADRHHHGKEEDILFERMVQSGFPKEGGPIAVMLFEHDQGRALIGTLDTLAGSAGPWSERERDQVFDVAMSFCSLLRDHINKEDNVLYPMARQQLTGDTARAVDDAVAAFDAANFATSRELTELLDSVAGRFLEDVKTRVDLQAPQNAAV